MGENSALCEKVLRKLENILERNSEIREFAIVQTWENLQNKSPILYEDNCLGLETWCKPYIQSYAHTLLLKHRKKLSCKLLSIDAMKNLNHALIGGILVQPNVTTFWNMKRELVENDILNIQQELYFNELVLSMYSKCYDAFCYRKWLLSIKFKKTRNADFFESEKKICERTAFKSPNNYHSWNFRIWCMDVLWSIHPEIESVILSELQFSRDWISTHISEYSGYNYRKYLIDNLKNIKTLSLTIHEIFDFNNAIKYLNLSLCNDDPFHVLKFLFGKSLCFPETDAYPKYINMLSVLLNDLSFITADLGFLYSNHECLWSFRKFLIIKLFEQIYDYHGMKLDYKIYIEPKCFKCNSIVNILRLEMSDFSAIKPELPRKILSSNFYNLLMKKELELMQANEGMRNSNELAKQYLKWLNLANIHNS